jgi:hypothetical protein
MPIGHPNRPILTNWTITDWTKYQMQIQLSITNALYVSSQFPKDYIFMRVLSSNFTSLADGQSVPLNSTFSAEMPPMGNKAEMKQIITATETAKKMMIYTTLVPFVFMIFMSFGMEKIWCLYLMLQIAGNINNYHQIFIPANC